jgi:hypothetical protein
MVPPGRFRMVLLTTDCAVYSTLSSGMNGEALDISSDIMLMD